MLHTTVARLSPKGSLQIATAKCLTRPTGWWNPFRGYATHGDARPRFWQKIPHWSDLPESQFLSYKWQAAKTVQKSSQLINFVETVLALEHPGQHGVDIAGSKSPLAEGEKQALLRDIRDGMEAAPMAVRLTPYILSLIDWTKPYEDPMFRQFIPLKSRLLQDHPQSGLDTLSETEDSPVKGLVHRYPDKALFLVTSVCPVYCRFCTRSYSIGTDTETVAKTKFLPVYKKWEPILKHIESTPQLEDIVVSGGDSYTLSPEQILFLGRRLLDIDHIRRIRFASKGLAVCPVKIIDP